MRLRERPRGLVRHAAHVLDPRGSAVLAPVALERDAGQRGRRLRAAIRHELGSQPRTMRALQVRPGGRLRWKAVPELPAPGPLAAVVRPLAVATCDLDRPMALGASPFPLPLCFGHECVAEVTAVGSEVRTVAPGDRVVVPFQISCGSCTACAVGHTANCVVVPPISMYGFGLSGGHWGGAFADELGVPFADGMLVPLPEGIEPAHAASVADNVADAWRHLGPHLPSVLARDPDTHVLILAAVRRHLITASVPLYAGLIAQALGARRVTVADARPEIREQAVGLGLDAVTPAEFGRLERSPLVVDASGSAAGLRLALSRLAPDGVCSSIGGLHPTVRLRFSQLYARNGTLHVGRTHARAVIPEVLALMVDGRLRPERVTTLLAPLDDAPAALGAHLRGESTKTILTA